MSRNLRILHCLRAPVGGLFRHVCDLALDQARMGHQVGIICDKKTGGVRAEKTLANLSSSCTLGIKRVTMPRAGGIGDLTAYLSVRRFAAKHKVQILHGHGAKGGAYARTTVSKLRSKKREIYSFYTPHGGSLHYSTDTLAGKLFLSIEKKLAPHTNGMIFESAYSSRKFDEKIGLGTCPYKIIYNGLLEKEFTPVETESEAADFIFIGELRMLKGVDLFLKSIAEINKFRPVSALIVGDGPDRELFISMAKSLSLSEATVNFTGAQPAKEMFKKARCLVIPSRAESFPYILLEAAAAQMPFITTTVGGIPEMVSGSDTLLVTPDDANALQEAMSTFLLNPQGGKDRAERLEKIVHGKFTIERMCTQINDFYLSVMKDYKSNKL